MSDKIWIYGWHAVSNVLEQEWQRIFCLYVDKSRQGERLQKLLSTTKSLGLRVEFKPTETLEKLTGTHNHQGIAAECQLPTLYHETDLKNLIGEKDDALILALDNLQDPHNLGACLRSAEASCVTAVIIPKDRSVSLTPTVYKVSSGAAEYVPIVQVTNLARTLNTLKEQGFWIYGADGAATDPLYKANFRGKVVLVMGSEGEGMRRLTRDSCDVLLSIPMLGVISSLNVSVATGIMLYEVIRQRKLSS